MGTKGPNVSPFTCLTIPKPRKLDLKANKINSLCFTHPPTDTENLLFPWESPCPSLVIPSHTGHHLHCKWDQGAELVGKITRKMKKRGKGKLWALLCDAVQCWDSPMSGQGQPRRRVENLCGQEEHSKPLLAKPSSQYSHFLSLLWFPRVRLDHGWRPAKGSHGQHHGQHQTCTKICGHPLHILPLCTCKRPCCWCKNSLSIIT